MTLDECRKMLKFFPRNRAMTIEKGWIRAAIVANMNSAKFPTGKLVYGDYEAFERADLMKDALEAVNLKCSDFDMYYRKWDTATFDEAVAQLKSRM